MIYSVDAVHDIFKRVIEHNLDESQMKSLVKELKEAGYEEQNIIITNYKP